MESKIVDGISTLHVSETHDHDLHDQQQEQLPKKEDDVPEISSSTPSKEESKTTSSKTEELINNKDNKAVQDRMENLQINSPTEPEIADRISALQVSKTHDPDLHDQQQQQQPTQEESNIVLSKTTSLQEEELMNDNNDDKDREVVVEDDDDGFKTPTGLEHKIPPVTECPEAPRAVKRKRDSPLAAAPGERIVVDVNFDELEIVFAPANKLRPNLINRARQDQAVD